jgi:hypothetical protein
VETNQAATISLIQGNHSNEHKSYRIAGKRGHHVHAYVDGELMGMFQSGAGALNGLKPGPHTLELRVVAEDHQTELDAFDRIEFMVK